MERKDYFSDQSKAYAAFRPSYPDELYQFIYRHLEDRSAAWDCATGNGQVARHLARHFDRVDATDISEQQLTNAFQAKNIFYSISPAEHTSFEDRQFDLITVGQALHWFNLPQFYNEVCRTGKQEGLLAVWGYALLSIAPDIDELFFNFYYDTVGPYWDQARRLVEDHYRSIPFPFEEIPCPEFYIKVEWSASQFTGYLSSWSATQKYIRTHNRDPVEAFSEKLRTHWKEGETKLVTFPVFVKLGRIRNFRQSDTTPHV